MNPPEPISVGERAPDFRLKTTPDQKIALSDYAGRPVVILFYAADFSRASATRLALFNEILPEFEKHHAQVLGISVDSVWSHAAFAKQLNIHFPLLADFNPKGEVAQEYNTYADEEGEAVQAAYLVDRDGRVAWAEIAPPGINPGADGVLKALEGLDEGRLVEVRYKV